MITVTYDSEILGRGEHWRGNEDEVDSIPNIPARTIAKRVARDGLSRSIGMWRVEQIDDQSK